MASSDGLFTIGKAKKMAVNAYNYAKPAVQNLTSKVGNIYGYAKPKVQSITRKVKEITKQGYHTAKVKAIELKQVHSDNLLIQACLTGTAQDIDVAIKESTKIRERHLSTLKEDPNGTEVQQEVYIKNHDNEIARLNHLRDCMSSMFTKKSSRSSSSSSRSSSSPSRPSSSSSMSSRSPMRSSRRSSSSLPF
jgi:hypothetical protein